MMWASLLLIALAQPAPAPDAPQTTTTSVMIGRLDIPDELAPAVIPYLRCLNASNGMEVRSNGGVVAPPPGIEEGSDCSAFRRRAAAQGDALLRRRGISSASERQRRVEATLVSIDGFAGGQALAPQSSSKPEGSDADAED